MNKLLEDWHDLCSGRRDLDKSHFLGLFKANLTDFDLNSVFKYFEHAEQMESRTREVLHAGCLGEYMYFQQPELSNRQQLIAAADAWIREQARFCSTSGEEAMAKIASSVEVKFTDRGRFEELQALAQPEDDVSDHITHTVWHALPLDPDAIFALVEALYGIAANYNLAWYVVQPLLKMDLDFACYFEFWRLGGAGVLTEDVYWVRDERS